MISTDIAFSGSIPALYDLYLGPLLFQPYAQDLARRVAETRPRRILETAAGTGIVTEAMLRALPEAEIVATDLNPAMLDIAAARIDAPNVTFQAADALALPFEDEGFDAIACQFGAMFFPDRIAAYREARRVLKPGGRFLFNVWGRIEDNEMSQTVAVALARLFPDNPPSFFQRVPFGYHDRVRVEADLRAAGFHGIAAERVAKRSRAATPRDAAIGLCQGTPLRAEIEERDPARLDEATDAVADALGQMGGPDGIDTEMTAYVFRASSPISESVYFL